MNAVIKKIALLFPFVKHYYCLIQDLRSQLEKCQLEKSEFHFIHDYQKLVNNLISSHPIDEAMSLAVGGGYLKFGQIEKNILLYYGLKPNMSLLDYGCGSGRLAQALPLNFNLNYLGIDIVDELLDYARTKTPSKYRFMLNNSLSIPVDSESIDMICVFSVFTHLLHEESYIYMEEMKRILKPGGKLIFSFLEFNLHWTIFSQTVDARRNRTLPHLNAFIERASIKTWAEKLEFKILEIVDGYDKKFEGQALGQSIAVLEKN